jgi:hypothetical protein
LVEFAEDGELIEPYIETDPASAAFVKLRAIAEEVARPSRADLEGTQKYAESSCRTTVADRRSARGLARVGRFGARSERSYYEPLLV